MVQENSVSIQASPVPPLPTSGTLSDMSVLFSQSLIKSTTSSSPNVGSAFGLYPDVLVFTDADLLALVLII